MFGPDVDRDRQHTLWADTYYSRRRTEIGCIVWSVLSLGFVIVGLVRDFPLWSLVVVFGGPLLLLLLVARMPLGDVPIPFVMLASLGGMGWEFATRDYLSWSVTLVFLAYMFAYEEALSGLTKLRYLEAVAVRRYDLRHVQRCDDEHLVAKRRIWGYLLATSSSAVVASGTDSGGYYHLALLPILAMTFSIRSRVFASILSWFRTTRFVGNAINEERRWPHAGMALVNVVAYGLSLHWLVTHGSAFGAHIDTPWSGPAGADADWFGDLQTVAAATVLWTVAVFRFEWTG